MRCSRVAPGRCQCVYRVWSLCDARFGVRGELSVVKDEFPESEIPVATRLVEMATHGRLEMAGNDVWAWLRKHDALEDVVGWCDCP